MNNYSGKTPMVKITYKLDDQIQMLFAKLEYYNPTGSIKDRIAECMVDRAIEGGLLKEGQPIVETTSGNTGIALSAYGAITKHPVHIFMPNWVSKERIKLMKMYGANVHLVSKEENGFIGALEKADVLAKEIGAFKTNQFGNENNVLAHYNGTAVEILKQLPDAGAFVSGIGSGGTITGIGRRLTENTKAKIIAIEPDCAQTLAGKAPTRQHKIEGIGDDFIPQIFDKKIINSLLPINDDDAIAMSAKLAKELGLGVGISSGANFLGAALFSKNKSEKTKVVTVFSDDNKKYLSTVLADSPAPVNGMLSERITLLDVEKLASF